MVLKMYDFAYEEEIKDRSYESIFIGEKESVTKQITSEDVVTFASITDDKNPLHLDDRFAQKSIFKKRIVHGMLSGSLISAVLGTKLPGINTIYMSQNLKFLAPAYMGDILTATVEVIEKKDEKKILILHTMVTNQFNEKLVEGQAVVKKL
ncbi:MaoC family dehydratase [Anaerophilus nitritogenes]|uniref:MaoC family dehydratase n=1 Tax=Anaerophilus nitritogenes TaxID=2498136 RepID=UPI001FAA6DC1|nr:MaoC family dehydratase [Anaerophilus nitritogenes]